MNEYQSNQHRRTVIGELRFNTSAKIDQLMLVGVWRKEARRRVQPKINALIASWREPELGPQSGAALTHHRH